MPDPTYNIPGALTSKERVKAALGIDVASFDNLIDQYIAGFTGWVESYCNRQFLEAKYSEIITAPEGASFLAVDNAPVTSVDKVEVAAGTPAARTWNEVPSSSYELEYDGQTVVPAEGSPVQYSESGIINTYFRTVAIPNYYRVTYTAGYKIDWTAETDATKHNLPRVLTDLATRAVSKLYSKRKSEGKDSEQFEGGSITWEKVLPEQDRLVLENYRRTKF